MAVTIGGRRSISGIVSSSFLIAMVTTVKSIMTINLCRIWLNCKDFETEQYLKLVFAF